MEYKEWHSKDGIEFHSQRRIYFSDADAKKILSLHELCRITSDVAVEDYRARGMSREFLADHGIAILVSRNSYRIHKWPSENQNVEFVTWEEKPQALQLVRCYRIFDEQGGLLVSGKSTWLIIDLAERRLMPTKKFTLREPPSVERKMDCPDPAKISYDDAALELWDSRKIKFSDIDSNGHTNNARYAAFVEDALPAEFQQRAIKEFRLNYSQEAMLGDEIFLYGKVAKADAASANNAGVANAASAANTSVADTANTSVADAVSANNAGGLGTGGPSKTQITLVGKTKSFVSFEAELFF